MSKPFPFEGEHLDKLVSSYRITPCAIVLLLNKPIITPVFLSNHETPSLMLQFNFIRNSIYKSNKNSPNSKNSGSNCGMIVYGRLASFP